MWNLHHCFTLMGIFKLHWGQRKSKEVHAEAGGGGAVLHFRNGLHMYHWNRLCGSLGK